MNPIPLDSLEQAKATLIDLGIKFGPKVLTALAILIAGFMAARYFGNLLQRGLNKREMEPPVKSLIIRIARILVLALFFIMALTNLGVDLLPIIAGLGVAGVGVGLAMQGVLSNLFAGLTIIFTKPFRVGEYISLLGIEGRVETIDIFSTVLSHPDLSRIVIPNRKIVGEILHNYGRIRQLQVNVGVAYGSDLNRTLGLIEELLRKNSLVLKEPAPVVGMNLLADSSINIVVKPWVAVGDYGAAITAVNKSIVERFRENHIQIPFPQREVRLLNGSA